MAAALFTLVALLGVAGLHTRLDQYAVDHWMPGIDHGGGSRGGSLLGPSSLLEALIPGWTAPRGGNEGASLATYVVVVLASGLPSVLVCGGAVLLLWRRGRASLALLMGAAFVIGNLIEIGTKIGLERDMLHTWVLPGSLPRILPYDHSFPSGHSLRSWLMAGSVALLWPGRPRLHAAVWLWAVAVLVMLVVGAWHTPTDVVGGALLAVLMLAAAQAAEPWLAQRLGERGPGWLRDRG